MKSVCLGSFSGNLLSYLCVNGPLTADSSMSSVDQKKKKKKILGDQLNK